MPLRFLLRRQSLELTVRTTVTRDSQVIYEFGPYRFDGAKRLLLRDGEVVPLTPKCFEILLVLLENSGQIVGKEDLMKRVWPDSFVEDGNLTFNISVLRKALGKKANEHRFIVTVPGRGYQFVAAVSEVYLNGTEKMADETSSYGAAFELAELNGSEGESGLAAGLRLVEQHANPNPSSGEVARRSPGIWRRKFVIGTAAVLVLAVIGAGAYLRFASSTATPIRKVAVVPLINGSGDPEMEYLSDGISESLINNLSQLPGVKVIARASSFKYKGKEIDPQELAKLLGVEGLVLGSVTQRGDSLFISVELMDARDETQIWGSHYSRRTSDLMAVQSEISSEIARTLRLKLTVPEQQQLAKRETVNPEAYELVLRGRFHREKRGTENLLTAVEDFKRAIAVDPGYATAYAELCVIYTLLSSRGILDPKQYLPQAEAAARRALGLDENLAEAHFALANLEIAIWDWTAAAGHFERALELNPGLARARFRHAVYLSIMRQHDEAVAEIERARELNPLSLRFNANVGLVLFLARRYDEGISVLQNTLAMDNSAGETQAFLGQTYAAKGMYVEAIAAYQEAIKLGDDLGLSTEIHLGAAYAMAGQPEKARVILKRLQTSKEYVSPGLLPILYAVLDEREEAFASLERAYAEHDPQLQYLGLYPGFDPIRSDPRFQDLLRRVGLPQ